MATAGRMDHAEAADAARRVEALIARHGPALLRVANQFSLCHDDALDAYQRALEIYLRRLATVDPATEGSWLRVVVKHEAMAIRRARQGAVDHEEVDFDASLAAPSRDVADRVAGGERVSRSVEALRALKPDEATALMLKAEGLSYAEIARRFGWSYTKVNRSITEGRARFMKAFRGIETGEACASYAESLEALAAGTATRAQVLQLRPHLRHCATCRAAVRDLRISRGRRIALLTPLPLLRVAVAIRHHAASAHNRVVDPTPLAGARPGVVAAAVAGCLAAGGGAAYCVKAHVDPVAGFSALAGEPQHHAPRVRPHRHAAAHPLHRVTHAEPRPAPIVITATPTPQVPTVHATPTPPPVPLPSPTATPTPPPAPQDEFQPSSTPTNTTHAPAPATPAPAAPGGAGEFDGP